MKRSLDDLALFGGRPAFDEPLHVGRPNIPDEERLLERLRGMLSRRWLTNDGPLVREFEARVAELTGAEHCVAVANGTLGLEIASRALNLGGEVIVPAFTFVATAHALQWQEITPVFCDIDRRTHAIDPAGLEDRITPRTTGILPVHLWGQACEIDAVLDVALRHGLKVLFDASHAFHCTYGGRPLGAFGDAAVFSFHATKFVNCFEGGAVVTSSAPLAERMRFMRNFGFAGYDDVRTVGINGKMSEASAAMGLTSLESIDAYVAANRRNLEAYLAGLAGLPGLSFPAQRTGEQDNFQYVVAEIDSDAAGLDRDQLLRLLWAENVRVRRYFYPGVHRMEPYASRSAPQTPPLPVTDTVCSRVMQFPTGTSVSPAEIEAVCGLMRFLVENGPAIRGRLADEPAADV